MLTLTFLGVGNAFAKRNFQSNALLEAWSQSPDRQGEPDDTLLIDLGGTGPLALHQLKDLPGFAYLAHRGVVLYPKIRNVFITHLHADHVGGLEELALMNTFACVEGGAAFRPRLVSTAEILADLWEHSLKGGLGVLQRRRARIEDYFVVTPVNLDPGQSPGFLWTDRYALHPFPTDHLRLAAKYDWPSLGVVVRDTGSGDTAFYSGDTRFDFDAYGEQLQRAKLCFHEVSLSEEEFEVHSTLSQLRSLPAELKAKTYLYHYADDWDSGGYDWVDREFAGFARPFQRYVVFD